TMLHTINLAISRNIRLLLMEQSNIRFFFLGKGASYFIDIVRHNLVHIERVLLELIKNMEARLIVLINLKGELTIVRIIQYNVITFRIISHGQFRHSRNMNFIPIWKVASNPAYILLKIKFRLKNIFDL